MKSILVVLVIFLLFSGLMQFACHSDKAQYQIDVSKENIKKEENFSYRYRINNYEGSVNVIRNENGTFFMGDFSSLQLTTKLRTYYYTSTGFSFKYPPQHKIANLSRQTLEMQIIYQLQSNQTLPWKHHHLIMSVSFVETDYAPPQSEFTLAKQINRNMENGTIIDLKKLLPLLPHFNMILYKGKHSDFPEDNNSLWLVRKELLLMGEEQLQEVKGFIFKHTSKENIQHHGFLKRNSDLYQIPQLQLKISS